MANCDILFASPIVSKKGNLTMETMLSKALREFLSGPLNQLIVNLGGQDGDEWERQLKRFLRKESCWTSGEVTQAAALKSNRTTFTVVGTALSGAEWPARLEAGGHKINDCARDLLSRPDYDANHRLEAGKVYTLALVQGLEIPKVSKRTTSALQAIGVRDYGPQASLGLRAELDLLICEKFTNKQLKEMGLGYIAVLHTPIIGSHGHPFVLSVDRVDGTSWVRADYDSPGSQWGDRGAFPVLVE